MRTRQVNEEVLYPDDPIVAVARNDIEYLKDRASHVLKRRIRLCTHRRLEDTLHEMLIVQTAGSYVRPHKHLGRVESFHIIEGSADVVFFDDNGRVTGVVSLGDYMSGRCFYCRLDNDIFHTLLIHSDHIVFHETTTGPFNRASTVFAQWSPAEEETQTVIMYLKQLTTLVNNYPVG